MDLILKISKTNGKEKFKGYLVFHESFQNRISEIDFFLVKFHKPYIFNFEI